MSESDPIVLASFYNPRVCGRFQRALEAAGIPSYTRLDGMKTTVAVSFAHREQAHEVLAKLLKEYPDRRPRGIRRDFDFTILGGLLGAVAGVMSLNFSPNHLMRAIAWGGFIGSGLIVGYFLDRCRRSYRYAGHLQFSMIECFLLLTSAALIISFWRFVVHISQS